MLRTFEPLEPPLNQSLSFLLASSEYLLTARRQLSVLFGERELSIDWAAHEGLLPAPSEGVFAALLLPPPLLTTVMVLGLEALPHFPRIFRRLATVRHPSFLHSTPTMFSSLSFWLTVFVTLSDLLC